MCMYKLETQAASLVESESTESDSFGLLFFSEEAFFGGWDTSPRVKVSKNTSYNDKKHGTGPQLRPHPEMD